MRIRHWLTAAGLCALLVPMQAAAQEDGEYPWSVDVSGGALIYQEASSLETGVLVGIEALYHITPRLSVGPGAQYIRAETDPTFFVGVYNFGADSTRVYHVGQRINTLQYAGVARFDVAPDATLNPYVTAGAGGYTLYLETQSNDGFERLTELLLQFGGGVHYGVSESAGIQLDVRDVVYTNFDRAQLNPIPEANRNCPTPGTPSGDCRFPAAERDLPAAEETLHNIRISLGLTYIPGLNR